MIHAISIAQFYNLILQSSIPNEVRI